MARTRETAPISYFVKKWGRETVKEMQASGKITKPTPEERAAHCRPCKANKCKNEKSGEANTKVQKKAHRPRTAASIHTHPRTNNNFQGIMGSRFPIPPGTTDIQWSKKWKSVTDTYGKKHSRASIESAIISGEIRKNVLKKLGLPAEEDQE